MLHRCTSTFYQTKHLSTQGGSDLRRTPQADLRSIANVASTSSQQSTYLATDPSAVAGLATAEEMTSQLPSKTQCGTPSPECSSDSCLADKGPSTTVLSIFHCMIYMENNYNYFTNSLLINFSLFIQSKLLGTLQVHHIIGTCRIIQLLCYISVLSPCHHLINLTFCDNFLFDDWVFCALDKSSPI